MTHSYDQTNNFKLSLRPEFDAGDIFKIFCCKMAFRKLLNGTPESHPKAWGLRRVLPISSKFQRFGCLCSNLSCFSLIKIEIGVFRGIIVCVSPVSFFISSSGAKGTIGCPIGENVNSVTFRVTALSREFVKLQFDSQEEFVNCLKIQCIPQFEAFS